MDIEDLPPEEARRRILEELDLEHARWRRFVLGLKEEDATAKGEHGWSPVYALAHVTSWKDAAARIAQGQADPETPEVDPELGPSKVLGVDVERFNEGFIASLDGLTAEQALAWAEEVHHYLLRELAMLPANRLLHGPGRHGARLWYWRPAFVHSEAHRARAEEAAVRG